MTNINLLPNGQVARSLLSHLRDVAERSLAPLSYCKENATNFWGKIPLKLLCLGPHRTAVRKPMTTDSLAIFALICDGRCG